MESIKSSQQVAAAAADAHGGQHTLSPEWITLVTRKEDGTATGSGRWTHLMNLLPMQAPGTVCIEPRLEVASTYSPGTRPRWPGLARNAMLPSAQLAALHWRRAAALGDPSAQATVAAMYAHGILGVPRSISRSASLLSFAAAGRGVVPLPAILYANATGPAAYS